MKIISISILIALCIGSALAVLPIIDRNINEPNLIAYFNPDEAFLMDLIWYYYSGQKRESFQYESDYGLEMLYLSDIARSFLSKLINFTPGIFVLLMRWLNLFFWVLSLWAAWALVRRHFGTYWQPLLVAALLAARQAFPSLCQNSKPDAIVLFFMIMGLNYSLRIIEKPTSMNMVIAIASASIAALIKFAGIFLLPVIVVSLYFSGLQNKRQTMKALKIMKHVWLLPAGLGMTLLILSSLPIFFYVRQSTGLTWYEEFGFLKTLTQKPLILYSYAIGVILMGLSAVFYILNRNQDAGARKMVKNIYEAMSYGAIVLLYFSFFTLIFGFKWVINIKHFMQTLATTGTEAFMPSVGGKGIFSFGRSLLFKVREFDFVILLLSVSYIFVEIRSYFEKRGERMYLFKRAALFVLVAQAFLCMLLPVRFVKQHMLPFFVAGAILASQCLVMLWQMNCDRRKRLGIVLCTALCAMLAFGLIYNAKAAASSFMYIHKWQEDVVFDIVKWWRANYPATTPIVADTPIRVYLPPEYKNVKYAKFQKGEAGKLRDIIKSFKPALIYYNREAGVESLITSLDLILPAGVSAGFVKSFDGAGKEYRAWPRSQFVIYSLRYDNI